MLKKMIPLIFAIGCSGCDGDKADVEEVVEVSPITWTECGYDMGDHPCDFTLKDQNGDDWNLYENYGSIIILDFSAEWCYYCQVAAADAQTVQDAYAEDNLIYVTLMIEDQYGNVPSQSMLTRWADHFGITAPVLAGDRSMIASQDSDGWSVGGWPTFFFIDKEMVTSTVLRGYSDEAMTLIIDEMLMSEVDQQGADDDK